MNTDIWSVLRTGLEAGALTSQQWQILKDWERTREGRVRAWEITPDDIGPALEERFKWLQKLAPQISEFPLSQASLEFCLPFLWELWLPLALRLGRLRQRLQRPMVYGLLGGQGTGKTTLSRILQLILNTMGYSCVGFSIDDIYKTYEDRQKLRQIDPRMIWRGPPGTHDVNLGIEVLKQVRRGQYPITFPRFDKSLHGGQGDRGNPEVIDEVDIVLFEGWFLGTRPLEQIDWMQAPPPIKTDADRQFANDMNVKLREYLPLWEKLDYLMILIPEDYRISQKWRMQAEQQMRADGKAGMTDEDVVGFVQYFWKALHPELFILPLRQAEWVDLVVEVRSDRRPQAIYSPSR